MASSLVSRKDMDIRISNIERPILLTLNNFDKTISGVTTEINDRNAILEGFFKEAEIDAIKKLRLKRPGLTSAQIYQILANQKQVLESAANRNMRKRNTIGRVHAKKEMIGTPIQKSIKNFKAKVDVLYKITSPSSGQFDRSFRKIWFYTKFQMRDIESLYSGGFWGGGKLAYLIKLFSRMSKMYSVRMEGSKMSSAKQIFRPIINALDSLVKALEELRDSNVLQSITGELRIQGAHAERRYYDGLVTSMVSELDLLKKLVPYLYSCNQKLSVVLVELIDLKKRMASAQ